MLSLAEAQALAKKTLSPKRFLHVQGVAAAARALALRYGEDPDKAELAGWLHDIVKEHSRDELLQMMGQDAIMAGSTAARPLPVWHGPCGSIYARHTLGVQDEDVLSAIACHTTGKANMSTFDKILYLADLISAERSFPGVGRLRSLAQQNLNAAVIAAMEAGVAHLQKVGKPLDEDTVKALEALKKEAAGPLVPPAGD